METLDINGKPLEVGDEVYYTIYKHHEIFKGKIIRISKKQIYIDSPWCYPTVIRKDNVGYRVVKIS